MNKRRGESDGFVEICPKCEVGERERKMVYGVTELREGIKRKMGEGLGEEINCVRKRTAKGEVEKRGWEMVYGVVKIMPQSKVRKRERKVVNWEVEFSD